jgi:hypothetical protein
MCSVHRIPQPKLKSEGKFIHTMMTIQPGSSLLLLNGGYFSSSCGLHRYKKPYKFRAMRKPTHLVHRRDRIIQDSKC